MALGESNDSFGVVTRRQAREIIKKKKVIFVVSLASRIESSDIFLCPYDLRPSYLEKMCFSSRSNYDRANEHMGD